MYRFLIVIEKAMATIRPTHPIYLAAWRRIYP